MPSILTVTMSDDDYARLAETAAYHGDQSVGALIERIITQVIHSTEHQQNTTNFTPDPVQVNTRGPVND